MIRRDILGSKAGSDSALRSGSGFAAECFSSSRRPGGGLCFASKPIMASIVAFRSWSIFVLGCREDGERCIYYICGEMYKFCTAVADHGPKELGFVVRKHALQFVHRLIHCYVLRHCFIIILLCLFLFLSALLYICFYFLFLMYSIIFLVLLCLFQFVHFSTLMSIIIK